MPLLLEREALKAGKKLRVLWISRLKPVGLYIQ